MPLFGLTVVLIVSPCISFLILLCLRFVVVVDLICLLLVFVGCLLVKVVVLKGNSWLWNLLLKVCYHVDNFYWKVISWV